MLNALNEKERQIHKGGIEMVFSEAIANDGNEK